MKRIVTVQDISCIGKCSLTVALPIISAMGTETAVIPTAVLSAHTAFDGFVFTDLTDRIEPIADHWQKENIAFDAVYTGYLGSYEQINIVESLVKRFRADSTKVIVDPVMGDHGELYKTYTPALCEKMKGLVRHADILTPNLTELCTLLGVDYGNGKFSHDELEEMCSELASQGPEHIVVTGIHFNRKQIMNFIYSKGEEPRIVMVDRIGDDRSGTGDVISSVIAGMYMNGHNFYKSVKKAANFASECISYCEENDIPSNWGLPFEMYLKDLMD